MRGDKPSANISTVPSYLFSGFKALGSADMIFIVTKYLLIMYCTPDMVLGLRDIVGNKRDMKFIA